MRVRILGVVLLGTIVAPGRLFAVDDAARAPEPGSNEVQFTIRICEGSERMQFWFNDDAKSFWDRCQHPLTDVPVFIVTESGSRTEAKTGKDGIAELARVTVPANEKFRLAMACTTHRCLSLHGLFIGGNPFVQAGKNLVYVETVPKPQTSER